MPSRHTGAPFPPAFPGSFYCQGFTRSGNLKGRWCVEDWVLDRKGELGVGGKFFPGNFGGNEPNVFLFSGFLSAETQLDQFLQSKGQFNT